MKKGSGAVIPIPQARERNLPLHGTPENKADSSVRQRTSDFGMTSSCHFQQPVSAPGQENFAAAGLGAARAKPVERREKISG